MKPQLYIILIFLLISVSCKNHKNIATQSVAISQIVATNDSTGEKRFESYDWSRLMTAADSLNFRLAADSIITPDGATIHNPVIDISAKQPSFDMEKGSSESSDEKTHQKDSTNIVSSSQQKGSSQEGKVVITEPPDKWAWPIVAIAIAAMIIAAFLWWVCKKK